MSAYMTQQLFNMCAVSTAKISVATSHPVEVAAAQLAENYACSYQDEDLAQDIAFAATKVSELMRGVWPPDALVGSLTQLQFCIKYYDPSGKKIRRKLFSGTWFNKESTPIQDKVEKCVANIATFYILVLNGTIPPAPDGWNL